MPRSIFEHPSFTLLCAGILSCGPSAEEVAAGKAKAVTEARMADYEDDPASFLMERYRPGEALFTWKQLSDTNCDLNQVHLWTPYEAHILRQVPYVIRGYPMGSEALRVFFQVDGEWYKPREEVEHFQPSQEEVQCAKKLKSLEERFYAANLEVPQAAKDRFIMDPEAFRTWFQWGSGRVNSPYTQTSVHASIDGGWVWEAFGVRCRYIDGGVDDEPCSKYTMNCPAIPPGLTPSDMPCEGTIIESVRELSLETDLQTTEDG